MIDSSAVYNSDRPPQAEEAVPRARWIGIWATVLLAAHGALLLWGDLRQAPIVDEPVHLAGGIRRWQSGRFDIDRGNPPLVGAVASVPVLLAGARTDWSRAPDSHAVGRDFARINGPRTVLLVLLGRLACVPFSLLGGYVCFRWARELYGPAAGLVSLALWCLSPNILAHGQLVTGDMAATATGIAAFFAFWKWLRVPSLRTAAVAGCVLGLAELTKFVWVVLYALWPVLWILWRWQQPRAVDGVSASALHTDGKRPAIPGAWHMSLILLLGIYLTNMGYLFDGTFEPLAQMDPSGSLLGRLGDKSGRAARIASLPVPLPADYVGGICEIGRVRDARPWSYASGQFFPGGIWWFYIYALSVKLSLGTLALIVAACFVGGGSERRRTERFLLVAMAGVFAFVACSGTAQNLRYVLPVLPLAFVWAGRVGCVFAGQRRLPGILVVACLGWSVAGSLWVYPHSLSYFNELVGGPRHGGESLIDSNMDWGQDLLYLKRWLDAHPDARPLHLAYFGCEDPRDTGIEFSLPPKFHDVSGGAPEAARPDDRGLRDNGGPQPGWHAVSVNLLRGFLRGFEWQVPSGKGGTEGVGGTDYDYFLHFRPAARAGYSISIYHITPAEANRVRKELGLPPCAASADDAPVPPLPGDI